MTLEESKQKKEQLKKLIFALAEESISKTEVRKKALELQVIYAHEFRHDYSDFFPYIIEISKDETEFNVDYLGTNLESLKDYVNDDYIKGDKEFEDIYINLNKLCDHLNLEIARMSYYTQNEKKVSDLEISLKNINQDYVLAEEKLKAASEKVSSVQTELIAVLSIFSAIVMTFSGSISFISSTISAMSSVPVFKCIFVLLISGVVVFNTIFLLLYFVGKIMNRNIYARCETENCTCGTNGKPKCKGVVRIRKRLPYVFYFNLFMGIMVIADMVSWLLTEWI